LALLFRPVTASGFFLPFCPWKIGVCVMPGTRQLPPVKRVALFLLLDLWEFSENHFGWYTLHDLHNLCRSIARRRTQKQTYMIFLYYLSSCLLSPLSLLRKTTKIPSVKKYFPYHQPSYFPTIQP
jgi:hypothetical protein